MSDFAERPNRLPWPGMVYLAAILVATVLNAWYPLRWMGPPLADILFAVGWLLLLGAIALVVGAWRTLAKANTTVLPHQRSEHLVTAGPFSFTRNPIYLAFTMAMFALALIAEVWWFLPLGLIAAFATQKLAIEREERHLQARFGRRYHDYARRVRRWI